MQFKKNDHLYWLAIDYKKNCSFISKRGQNWEALNIWKEYRIFTLYPILMQFFCLNWLCRELAEGCWQIYLFRRIYLSKFVFHVSSFVPTLSDCHCKLKWEISANYCVSGELDVPIKAYDISQILFGLMTRQLNFNLIYRQTKFKTVYPNLTIYKYNKIRLLLMMLQRNCQIYLFQLQLCHWNFDLKR
jgi:hypothetical protein